jgi:site-specific DNA-methyltransferase (adenine-specific)
MIRCEDFGTARLYLGDSLEILPTLSGIDAVITDPPYSSGGMLRSDRMQTTRNKYQSTGYVAREHENFTGDNRDQRGFLAWASLWMMHALDVTQPGGVIACFTDWRQLPTMTDAIQSGGWVWRGIVPWDKVNARPMPNRFKSQCEYVVWGTNGPRDFTMDDGASYHPGIVSERPPANDDREHSTQKPVGVMAQIARIAPEGGLVLDPFMGSGTTGVACAGIGRRFIGIEKSPAIFDIACRRVAESIQGARNTTGKPQQERLLA